MTQTQKERLYYLAGLVVRNLLKLFWVFPVKKNRITLISYSGTQYSCNPKYISNYLRETYPQKFDVFFVVRNPEKWNEYDECFVKFPSIACFYYFCTSRVIVSNCGMMTFLPKRKQQYVINTWHGGGAYKTHKTGGNLDVHKKTHSRTYMDLYKSRCTDLVLSSCEIYSRRVVPELVYQYQGEIMPCGMPRNDIFYQENHAVIRKKVCDRLGIDKNREIVLYAPTYRGSIDGAQMRTYKPFTVDLNVMALLDTVSRRFQKKPILLIKAHHAMDMISHFESENVVNVSGYPDTQELLCTVDVLISDYSSIIWDFSLTKRPCFLYVPDLDCYMNDDRGTYTPIETWPGVLAKSNEELQDAILTFNEADYVKKVEAHHRKLGSYETGTACAQVCARIAQVCGIEKDNGKRWRQD